ncbi:hypothetical protein BCR32DRAFT_129369 [Anaeromyces robustus]|uniref:WD40 repeat-like protein n=1 Tax=Anaeromyces robustus TaxID=1754192 RepID=A0A1Y1XF66_9FUNG|nr:hypothetical protein BCR32DRAFT_129369 [Anaeromyces robustus]|eukprot:ORX84385.1 hypothetical protein BCR32DRAFT_129369 [Anaeromyces robustus]
MKSQTEIENILIIPLSLKISRPKISEAKQIIVGCSDGSLRIFNLSTINNKYIEIFHYEIGQENINNNKTASYNSHLGITFTDREYKAKLMKWKSIKEVYRSNIVGLSVNINDFVLAIGYTNDDNLYFFNPHELYPLRNVNILMNRNASKEITEYVKNLPQYTEYIKKNKINTKITTLLNTKCNVTDFIQRHIYFFNNTSKFVICNSNEWCIFSCNDLIDKYKNIYNYISINT